MSQSLLLQFIVNGLIVGTLYGVVAMCFVLIYKASQVVNFAQGELLLIGAWVCWWIMTSLGLPFWAAFPIALAFMMIFGVLLQVVVLRPLIGQPTISVIMVTIGLSMFLQALMKWIIGISVEPFPRIFAVEAITVFGLNVQTAYVMSIVCSVVIVIGFGLFFRFSRMGLAMRAAAFDQQVAQSMGISIRRVFAMSWAISAVVSTMAGVVFGIVSGLSSALSLFGIKVFPAVILGGLDSIGGAVLGGLIVGVIENVAEFADGQWLHLGNLYQVVPFYVLVIILMIKPYGLFGTRTIERI